MILVLSPSSSERRKNGKELPWKQRPNKSPFFPPVSFLKIELTTPYRSTIAITKFARFIGEGKGLKKRKEKKEKEDIGSDVVGIKPTFFEVKGERMMEEALAACRIQMGGNATILFDSDLPQWMKNIVRGLGKEAGGLWDC